MTRRAPGDGSVYRTVDGRWRGAVTVRYKVRKVVSGHSSAEVEAKISALIARRDGGELDLTVADLMAEYLTDQAPKDVRPSTLCRYTGLAAKWITPTIGTVKILDLKGEHIERLHRVMRDAGQSEASTLQAHRVLSRVLKIAVDNGRLVRNPCHLVATPSIHREEIRPLTVDEARRILAAAGDDAARWAVALGTGLRQGEALGLAWADVDLDAGTLTVRNGLQRIPGQGLALVSPKSQAGHRTIALPASVVAELAAHRQAGSTDAPLVFARPDGGPTDPRADWRSFKRLLKAAGVRDVRVHDCRHSAASFAKAGHAEITYLSRDLGHTRTEHTVAYMHLDEDGETISFAHAVEHVLFGNPA
jgi:integrase